MSEGVELLDKPLVNYVILFLCLPNTLLEISRKIPAIMFLTAGLRKEISLWTIKIIAFFKPIYLFTYTLLKKS